MTDIARLQLEVDSRKLKEGERDLGSFRKQSRDTAADVDRAASGISGSFRKIGGALLAAGLTTSIYQFGKASVQAAIDAQEMGSAFEVVFGKMADDVRKWAEETGNAMGRSTQEIMRGALAFQELFGKALDPAKAAEMSKQFAVLTQDLASFKNLSNEVAQQKLFSGLTGESEPLRAVGVFINEAAVKAKALELGLKGVNGALTDQEKIVARAALIQEQLAQASGDVERTSGSTANQIKAFNAAVEELQVAIGQKLLPVFTPLVTGAANVVTSMANMAQSFSVVGISINSLMTLVASMVAGWAAYRLAILAGSAATAIMNSTLALTVGVVASTTRAVGVAAGAQVAMSAATAGATTAFRGLTAAMVANPFGAVAVAVGALSAAFMGLAMSQRQARAETNNLIMSLRGLAQARSADYASRRAEAVAEQSRLQTQIMALENGVIARNRAAAGLAPQKQLTDLRQQLLTVNNELFHADKAFKQAESSMSAMTVPAPVAAAGIANIGKSASGAAGGFKAANDNMNEFSDSLQSLVDKAFPHAAKLRELNKEIGILQAGVRKGLLSPDVAAKAEANLRRGAFGDVPLSDELQKAMGVYGVAQHGLKENLDKVADATGAAARKTGIQTVTIAKSFKDMAESVTSSLQNMANAIQGGGFLNILSSAISLFLNVASTGLFGKGLATKINTPAPSFDGGGYTGSGPRSGGLDGKGGFLAMLHPQETVVDHTKGQGAQKVHVTVGIDPRNGNVTAFVNGQIAATAPVVANAGAMQAQAMGARAARRSVRR